MSQSIADSFLVRRSLRRTLIIWFLIISLIPLTLVIISANQIAQDLLRGSVEVNLNNIADHKLKEIERYVTERREDITSFANLSETRYWVNTLAQAREDMAFDDADAVQQRQEAVNTLERIINSQTFPHVYLFDRRRQLLAATRTDLVSQSEDIERDAHFDELARVVERAQTLLQTEISDFNLNDPDDIRAYIAAPVFDDGVLIGVVAFEINNQDIFGVIQNTIGLGSSGETTVALYDGSEIVSMNLLAQGTITDERRFGLSTALMSTRQNILYAATQGSNRYGITEDLRGVEVVAAGRYVPSLRWGMIVKQDTAEAFQAIRILQGSFLILGVMTLVGVLVAAFFLARTISSPINQLIDYTHQLRSGEFGEHLDLQRDDEMGQLAESFNMMADTIQKRQADLNQLNATLESRVIERTAELKQARDEAFAAQRIAQENSRLKSEFLSMMSHELRTPMNAIEGFTSIILNDMGGVEYNDKTRHYLTRIASNSKRLLGLINDFLDLSRIEAGRMELAHTPYAPHELAQTWYSTLSSLSEKKGLAFDVTVDANVPATLVGDSEAITKIVINLVGNAIKFTEQGQVSVNVHKQNGNLSISVKDTGIGIPAHAREFIFDEFRQVDMSSKRKYGGTGLGLSIVQRLTLEMGGEIKLESEVGSGSTFTVLIPIA